MVSDSVPSLRIGLLENSSHSLKCGYQRWREGRDTQDHWLLKEAVIWIHHGIEQALKQHLVQINEYLVFEQVDTAVDQLTKLRKKRDMKNASISDLFEWDNKIETVCFHKLVKRVAVLFDAPELADGAEFRKDIDELSKYRNQIMHFSFQLNVEEISSLLADILDPLLGFLEQRIEDEVFVRNDIPEIRQLAKPVQKRVEEFRQESELRIAQLMQRFNGQQVPGTLFGLVQEGITLPAFSEVTSEPRNRPFDILAKSLTEDWIVGVKLRVRFTSILRCIEQMEHESRERDNTKLWLVVMSKISPTERERIQQRGVLISDLLDVEKLDNLLSDYQ